MITIRHLERLFSDHQHPRLYRQLVAGRPEATFALASRLARVVPIAALGMIRLDELGQSFASVYRRLLNVLLTSQEADGGWGDPMATSLVVRALLAGGGQGPAVQRGLIYLANLQHDEGLWPCEGLRRMPPDPFVSAFILLQLGDNDAFRRSVRFQDALAWFTCNGSQLDIDGRRLWTHAAARCRVAAHRGAAPMLWSANRPAA